MAKIILKAFGTLKKELYDEGDGDWWDDNARDGCHRILKNMIPYFDGKTKHEVTPIPDLGGYKLGRYSIDERWVKPTPTPRRKKAATVKPTQHKKEEDMSTAKERAKSTAVKALSNTKIIQTGRVTVATAKAAITKMDVVPTLAKPFYGGVSGDIATALAVYVAIDILKKDHPLADAIKEGVATHALNALADKIPVEEFVEKLLKSVDGQMAALEGTLGDDVFPDAK